MVRDALPSKLVVGVDGSAAADAAVRWAVREPTMRRLRSNASTSSRRR